MLAEQQRIFFKFFNGQAVRTGMLYGKELYQLVKQFFADERLEAYRYGYEQNEQSIPNLISVLKQRYIFWECLRQPCSLAGSTTAPLNGSSRMYSSNAEHYLQKD